MEYIAKITKGERAASNHWKYTFLDIQSNREDYFYHNEQIDYFPNTVGRLNLYEDKSFKSFEQDLDNTLERLEVEAETKEIIEKVTNNLNQKKIKLSLSIQTLYKLHNQGFTWKQIAKIYGKHEQTIYYWLKTKDKVLQKRGTKPRINDETASLIHAYALENNTKTQQEIADYVCKELNIPISRPSITVLLKRLGITRKKLTYHYTLLNEVKAKAFNEEIKLLLPQFPFLNRW